MFKIIKRGDDDITIFTDDASQDLKDSVYQAHGDTLPNNWVFQTYSSLLDDLSGYTINSIDDIEDHRHEIVDGCVDIYTYDLKKWLSDWPNASDFFDQALEFIPKTSDQGLAMAQYLAIDEIYSEIINLLSK